MGTVTAATFDQPKLKRGPSQKALNAIDSNISNGTKTPSRKPLENMLELSTIH